MGLKSLNNQHKKFVRCYIEGFKPGVGFNATQAALKAGYAPKHAEKKGSELKNDPLIQAEIERTQQKIEDRTLVRMSDIVSELCKMGFGNIKNVISETGELIEPKDLDENITASISEYSIKSFTPEEGDPYTEIKYKFYDKRQALMDIAKLQGFLKDKGEQPAPVAFIMNLKGKKHGRN